MMHRRWAARRCSTHHSERTIDSSDPVAPGPAAMPGREAGIGTADGDMKTASQVGRFGARSAPTSSTTGDAVRFSRLAASRSRGCTASSMPSASPLDPRTPHLARVIGLQTLPPSPGRRGLTCEFVVSQGRVDPKPHRAARRALPRCLSSSRPRTSRARRARPRWAASAGRASPRCLQHLAHRGGRHGSV